MDYSEQLSIVTEEDSTSSEPVKSKEKKSSIRIGNNSFELFSYRGIQTGRRNTPDPLNNPTCYEPYHKHVERAEKRTQMTEREKFATEREKFKILKQDLEGPDWKKVLLGVTAVRDSRNKTECEEKKQKTIKEIDGYLNKFGEAREMEKKLRARQKSQKEDPGVDDFSESDQDETTSKTVRYKYSYVYDLPQPIIHKSTATTEEEQYEEEYSSPEVLPKPSVRKRHSETSSSSSKRVKSISNLSEPVVQGPFVSFFTKPQSRLRFDQLLHKSHRSAQAFGRPIPSMIKCEFELPDEFKEAGSRK